MTVATDGPNARTDVNTKASDTEILGEETWNLYCEGSGQQRQGGEDHPFAPNVSGVEVAG